MKEAIKSILEIQTRDIMIIQLIRLKKEREHEIEQIKRDRAELEDLIKESELEVGKIIQEQQSNEAKYQELDQRKKKIEAQQMVSKKIDEHNALNVELSNLERERRALEQLISDNVDKRFTEEERLEKTKSMFEASKINSSMAEKEIQDNLVRINDEALKLKKERQALSETADPEVLRVYERLLRNKKDEVVVPLQNRICGGCQIHLTAQHENLVRQVSKLVFCEHCSCILYWPQEEQSEGAETTGKRRRRRAAV